MAGRVAVVTDSTSMLDPEQQAAAGITVVPLQVVIGTASYAEGVEVSSATVADALRARTPVSTSRPSPEVFLQTYEKAAAEGAECAVSVHLSAEMSGTAEAAEMAAKESPIPVEVVDSRTIGMATGYAALTAAEAAAGGATGLEVADLARRRADASRAFFYVATLEYLRRGGRIGAAARLLGSALAVKPLLHILDGRVEPLEKVRTTGRALARLVELAADEAGEQIVDVTVAHLAAEETAADIADQLKQRIPGVREVGVGEVGAAIGAHVGPGMIAVVVAPLL